MSSWCGVLDSLAGLEPLSPDVVALSVASGAEYHATLDDSGTDGAYALLGTTRPRAAGVRLTSAATCDTQVVATRTLDTQVFVRTCAVRDRWRSPAPVASGISLSSVSGSVSDSV